MTYLLMHRHWLVGSFFVLIPLIVLAPHIRSLFHADDGFSKSDVNEPVGAVVGFLGSVYALATVFAFQSSRERIMHITEAIHAELSALQKMQILVRSSTEPDITAQVMQAVADYAKVVGVELEPDAYSFGNTMYSTTGRRCEVTRTRDEALFGTRRLSQLYECMDAMAKVAYAGGSKNSDAIATEYRELLGSVVDGRNRRLAHMMSRMPLAEWCFLELGSYTFMALMALLDTGDLERDRLLIAVTGVILLALNHIVADANEPLLGSFKVKKTLVNQFILLAGETAGSARLSLIPEASHKLNAGCRLVSIQECISEPDATCKSGADCAIDVSTTRSSHINGSACKRTDLCQSTPSTASILARSGSSVQTGAAKDHKLPQAARAACVPVSSHV